ncbi:MULTISPECIES: hypothetical protein [unclassified Clostridioides]|uniref:hypothetical protein n=1 Tax=unclassified Clostridioides TaxID=2635829 RepID=UPI001D10F510|nr:hypothetical protein [Clostridioides sp. ZZV15-6597]MCC0731248.1 hypothetical protein [Clostridioides sp. ZZV14-6048]
MATVSFDKRIVINKKEEIDKFNDIYLSENKPLPIDKDLASNEAMARCERLLEQYLSL